MLTRLRAPLPWRGISVLVLSLLLIQWVAVPQSAEGLDFWGAAKDYSAEMKRMAIQAANDLIAIAKAALDEALRQLEQARLRLQNAGALAATVAALAILLKASTKLAKAKAALVAALKGLAVLVAVGAAWTAGTVIGEGLDWLISRCWDPPCVMFANQAPYSPPTNAQLDGLIPVLLETSGASTLAATRAEFDSADVAQPGTGTTAWDFIRSGARAFSIAAEGAGASTAHLCSDVTTAAGDLEAELQTYITATDTMATMIENATIYSGDPRPDLVEAVLGCDSLIQYVDAHPEEFTDPVEVRAAAVESRNASLGAITALDAQSLPNGSPKPLQGSGGYLPDLTLADFQGFLTDCATQGPSALPPGEAATIDSLLGRLGLRYSGVTGAGWDMAAYVGEGDTGNEASHFTSGPLRPSEIYRTAIPSHWALIDPFASPTLTDCTTTGTPVQTPASPALVVRVSPSPGDGRPSCNVTLRHGAQVSIRVFSVSGELANEVYSGYLPPGSRRFDLGTGRGGARRLASGVYYVRVEAGPLRESRRFTILR